MPTCRISIIVPVRNEAGIIVTALKRLQPWRDRGHEIIVVDGDSSDDSAALAEPACDRLVRSRPGRARQMNAGAAAASGDVLLFLHVDTTLPLGAFADVNRVAAGGLPCWGRFDVRLDAPQSIFRLIETLMNWRSRVTGIATGDQAIFISRAAFARIGGFPPIALMEDITLSSALRKICWPVCSRVRVTTSARRWLQGGITKTILKMWWLRAAYFIGVSPDRLRLAYEGQDQSPA